MSFGYITDKELIKSSDKVNSPFECYRNIYNETVCPYVDTTNFIQIKKGMWRFLIIICIIILLFAFQIQMELYSVFQFDYRTETFAFILVIVLFQLFFIFLIKKSKKVKDY